jgi:predicted Fe-S protein YdhL (DUF1289 family)
MTMTYLHWLPAYGREEITRWSRMTNDERRVVLGLCHERAKASGLVWMIPSKS